jgi:hypothetical protein
MIRGEEEPGSDHKLLMNSKEIKVREKRQHIQGTMIQTAGTAVKDKGGKRQSKENGSQRAG